MTLERARGESRSGIRHRRLSTKVDGQFGSPTKRAHSTNLVMKWGQTWVVYLQHASDPVVFFSPSLFIEDPDWLLDGQRR